MCSTDELEEALKQFIVLSAQTGNDAVSRKASVLGHLFRDLLKEKQSDAARIKKITAENKSLNHFISIVSHDLNGSMASIESGINLYYNNPGQFELQPFIHFLENCIKESRHLLQDLLLLSSFETGKLMLNIKPTSLLELIKHIVYNHRLAAKAKNIAVSYTITKDTSISCDPVRIQQVLNNLLSNARKFTPNGGKIEVIATQIDPETVSITVKDNGIGIPKNIQKTLFNPETNDSRLGTNGEKGTGIGLPLSNEIIREHGEELRVKSSGSGTAFSFTLPIVQG